MWGYRGKSHTLFLSEVAGCDESRTLRAMAALESKGAENGDLTAPVATDSIKVETGEAHLPSAETISAAEALKAEGNALLAGEHGCNFRGIRWGIGWRQLLLPEKYACADMAGMCA